MYCNPSEAVQVAPPGFPMMAAPLLLHQSPPRPTKISFQDTRREVRVVSLACLSDELRRDIWYTPTDIEQMRAEARDLCRYLRVNPQACPEEHTRGLELRISLERQCRKQLAVQGVVEAQRRSRDPDFLACLAERCSVLPKEMAISQAQKDYCHVYKNDTNGNNNDNNNNGDEAQGQQKQAPAPAAASQPAFGGLSSASNNAMKKKSNNNNIHMKMNMGNNVGFPQQINGNSHQMQMSNPMNSNMGNNPGFPQLNNNNNNRNNNTTRMLLAHQQQQQQRAAALAVARLSPVPARLSPIPYFGAAPRMQLQQFQQQQQQQVQQPAAVAAQVDTSLADFCFEPIPLSAPLDQSMIVSSQGNKRMLALFAADNQDRMVRRRLEGYRTT